VSLRGNFLGTQAKIGFQGRVVYHGFHDGFMGGAVYLDGFSAPGEAGLCNEATGANCYLKITEENKETHQWAYGTGLYIQDRWKPTRRLTINPGFRFDWGHSTNTAGSTVSNLFGFGPRLGFTLDLTGDAKTILMAYYGRANETVTTLSAAYADPAFVQKYYAWDPRAGQFGTTPVLSRGGPEDFLIDPKASTPHTDEVTVGLRREVVRDSLARVDYTYKRISNIWDGVEVNQIWNPAGTQVVDYVDGKPHTVFKYTTPNGNYRTYQGLDFIFESRPNANVDIYAAYTLSWLYGPGAEMFGQVGGGEAGNSAFYNPRQSQFFEGFLPEDIRHQLKLRASYDWHGLNLGAMMIWRTGAPLTKRYFNPAVSDSGYTLLRSPQGTDPGTGNVPNNVSEFRTPDVMTVNLRVAYDFHEFIGQHHLSVIADFFNLFNLGSATKLIDIDTPTFSQVAARQTPFQFQIGLRYAY